MPRELHLKKLAPPTEVRKAREKLLSFSGRYEQVLRYPIEFVDALVEFIGAFGTSHANRLSRELYELEPFQAAGIRLSDLQYLCSELSRGISNELNLRALIQGKVREYLDLLDDLYQLVEAFEEFLKFVRRDLPVELQDLISSYGFDLSEDSIQSIQQELGVSTDISDLLEIGGGRVVVETDDVDAAFELVNAILTIVEWVVSFVGVGRIGPSHGDFEVSLIRAYHATVNLRSILQNGFKNTEEVETKGLGGSSDGGKISVTLSKEYAKRIASAIKFMVYVAKGKISGNEIVKWLKSEGLLQEFLRWTDQGFPSLEAERLAGVSLSEQINAVQRGTVYSVFQPRYMRTVEDMLEKGWDVVAQDGDTYVLKTEDRAYADDVLYEFMHRLFHFLEMKGILDNPLFFGVSMENFRKIDPSNVGVVEVVFDPNVEGVVRKEGMYEYRIPPDAIIEVKEVPVFA